MAGNLGTLTLDLVARIGGFTAPLDQAQRHAQSRARAINSTLSSIGVGISVAGIVAFAKSGIDAADALNDMSDRTGIAIDKLAGFQLATKLADTDMESFASAANKLSINIGKNSEEFAKLGITAKDPAEAFLQLADVFSSIEDPQERAAFGAKVLGKAYAEMAPLLLQGGTALREQVRQGQELSGINEQNAKLAGKFNDQLDIMSARLAGLSIKIVGPILDGFSQLAEKIEQATQSGVTFNNVMMGIGNFAFQNLVDDIERIGTLSTEVNAINDKIVKARENLSKAKTGPIDEVRIALGDNSKVIAAEQKLNDLLFERQKLIVHLSESRKKSQSGVITPNKKTISDFIGGGGGGGSKGKGGGGGRSAITDEQKAADRLQQSYESMLASLQKELALRGETSEAAKLQYEIINGGLKGISQVQADSLLALAKEKDALERQDKQWAALVESANEYYDVKKRNADVIKFGGIQENFNDLLAQTADSDLTPDQKKIEFDKLGKAFNDEFIEPAKEGTEQLSEFAIQAARNMETAFADFLFDPFNESLGSMVDNFAAALRKMAANYLSSQLFDLIKNGLSTTSTASAASTASSSAGWLTAIAGLFSSGSGAAAGGLSGAELGGLAMAKGGVFNSGNIIPFANGGSIINKPTLFPMAGGKTGLMGEAGPEAIMPLTHTKLGGLGVRVHENGGKVMVLPIMRGADGKLGVSFDKSIINSSISNSKKSAWAIANTKNSNIVKFANGGIFGGTENNNLMQFSNGGVIDNMMAFKNKNAISPLSNINDNRSWSKGDMNVTVNVNGTNNAPDVRRAAGQGAREALGFMSGASRYG